MQTLSQVLVQVQNRWPLGASLGQMSCAPAPSWALDAARAVVAAWSPAEYHAYSRQLPALVASLRSLHQRWVVAAALALLLAFVVVIAAATSGALNEVNAGVLLAVVSAILLPPFAICNGIACDYAAAHALLTTCGAVSLAQPTR